ncbi:hypothetical protein [Neobacillus muris]|uniref:hypothetical protein n=1 Tax=Neobacillus muris TaxID=2941334 RepID=UPI0020415908|nr:hypothetical protein [Neobacillus muris]
MYRNKNINIIILLLCCLLLAFIVHVLTHVRIYVVYSTGIGPILVIGLIIGLIVLLYFKG